jgi:hypothetical protein
MVKFLLIALTSLAFNGVSFAQAKPTTPALARRFGSRKANQLRFD